jgi:hypothetical protein
MTTNGPRQYRISSRAFVGFALMIAIDSALAARFNPDRHEVDFWIKLVIIFGGMLVWSVWIARRPLKGKAVAGAFSLLGIVTTLIAIGALISLTAGYPDAEPFPGRQVMATARILSGLYVLVVWVALIWDLRRARTASCSLTQPASGGSYE